LGWIGRLQVSRYVGEGEVFGTEQLDRWSFEQRVVLLANESGVLCRARQHSAVNPRRWPEMTLTNRLVTYVVHILPGQCSIISSARPLDPLLGCR
jgi:hypothetical protein